MTYHMISEIGNRLENQDSVEVCQKNGLFCIVLADGLGGHGFGKCASELSVKCVSELFLEKGEVTEKFLRECFEASQRLLLEEQRVKKRKSGMVTTLAILLSDGETIIWGYVGDTRIYHFQEKRIIGRTLDHSVPQMLVLSGEIMEQEIRFHPDRNRLLRVMGMEWRKPAYTLSEIHRIGKREAFLLCTDGFWELIEEAMMEDCLRSASDVETWLQKMKRIVLENGRERSMDNCTAIAVWM